MINASKILTVMLVLGFTSSFAQQKVQKATKLPEMVKSIQTSNNKVLYLQEFLNNVKTKPIVYGKSSGVVRDSVNRDLQLQYNALLLTIFGDAKSATNAEVKNSTKKAYVIAMQTINGDELTANRQKLLNQYVSETQQLIAKHSFLKN